MEDAIIINQSFWNRFKNLFSFKSFNAYSTLTVNGGDWHEVETDSNNIKFRWSHPKTTIEYENISALRIKFNCPIGREISIKNNKINFQYKLIPNKMYVLIINCNGTSSLTIETDAYMPENDTRSLGLCFFEISEHPALSCL